MDLPRAVAGKTWTAVTAALAACLLVLLAGAGPVPHAAAADHPAERRSVGDSDYTGVGTAPWRSKAFDDEDWLNRPEPGARCSQTPDVCRWLYNGYRLNCLTGTAGPAYELLWVSPEGTRPEDTYLMQGDHLALLRSQVRAAASAFGASNRSGFRPTNLAQKGIDRSPRLITTPPLASTRGTCEPAFRQVTVPTQVLMRHPMQARAHGDPSKPGVMAYLEEHGFDQPNRRYFLFLDLTPLTQEQRAASVPYRITWAQSVDLQSRGILWGPYGHGLLGDVDTRPGPENFCNRGGMVGWMSVYDSPVPGAQRFTAGLSPRTDYVGYALAHELGHTTCQNQLSPHWSGGSLHMTDDEDLMGDGLGSNQCGGPAQEARWLARFDCAMDDYWGQTSLTTKAPWTQLRWDSSNSEFLWGAPKPATQDDYFSIADVGIDCVNLGGCWD